MATDKQSNRSSSPTQSPSWINELTRSNQMFHRELQLHDASLREIRLISLENQQLLRALTAANEPTVSNSSGQPTRSVSRSSSSQSLRRASSCASARSDRSSVRSAVSLPSRPAAQAAKPTRIALTRTIKSKNAAVRNAAVPMPRIPRPTSSSPTICWYHKNFGKATIHCVLPCDYKLPVLRPKAEIKSSKDPSDSSIVKPELKSSPDSTPTVPPSEDAQISAIMSRAPLERSGQPKNLTDSDSSSTEDFPPSRPKPADWNKMADKEDSSSSSSDSN